DRELKLALEDDRAGRGTTTSLPEVARDLVAGGRGRGGGRGGGGGGAARGGRAALASGSCPRCCGDCRRWRPPASAVCRSSEPPTPYTMPAGRTSSRSARSFRGSTGTWWPSGWGGAPA